MNLPVANQQTLDPLTPKMAPWPETGTESKAPDISTCIKPSANQSTDTPTVNSMQLEDLEDNASHIKVDDKQIEIKPNPDEEVTNLNDIQLKALLDEALTYKRPKDREGKSVLFRNLLDKTESDKTECGDIGHSDVGGVRSGLRRYRGSRRDASAASSSETKGGSLQNLAQESAEFDTLGLYASSSSGRGRKAKKSGIGVSVSARQREGGSLPSNVNVGGCGMRTPLFDGYTTTKPKKKKETDKMSKESECSLLLSEYHRPQIPNSADCVFINVNRSEECRLAIGDNGEAMECDDGTEMAVMTKNYTTRAMLEVGQGDACRDMDREVDTQVAFPIKRSTVMDGINGSDTHPMQLAMSYNSVNSVLTAPNDRIKAPSDSMGVHEGKSPGSMQHVSEITITSAKRSPSVWPAAALASAAPSQPASPSGDNSYVVYNSNYFSGYRLFSFSDAGGGESVVRDYHVASVPICREVQNSGTRYTFSSPSDDKSKSFDENGNAVNLFPNNSDRRGKSRKSKPKENYTKFIAEEVDGYQGDKDVESLLRFIESDKDSKNKGIRNASSQPRSAALPAKGAKSRDRKLTKSEDSPAESEKIKRSNSLEEVSKTKLEDLTSGVTRRPKKQSTFDESDMRGDRRSWGTEEGQAYYCTDPDESVPSRRKRHEDVAAPAEETEFHIVTKKQRRKKRRSSSGGREDGQRPQPPPTQQHRRGNSGGFPPHDRDVLYQYRRPRSPDMRRKSTSSMPPSDKSDSSDLDSVHSLPVSSTMPKSEMDQIPHASYADIAKSSNSAPPINININVNASKWPAIVSSKINIGTPPVSASRLHSESDETPRGKKSVNNAPVNFKTVPLYQNDEHFAAVKIDNSSNKFTKNSPTLEDNYSSVNKNKVLPAISDDVVKDLPAEEPLVSASDTSVEVASVVLAPTHKQCSDITVAKSDLSDYKSNVKVNNSLPKDGKGTNINKRLNPSSQHNPRPAVIILDEKESISVSQNITSEITFGFEINSELLQMSNEVDSNEDNGDSLNSTAVEATSTENPDEESEDELLDVEAFCNRYRPPTDVKATPDIEAVVNFIGCAWDDVSRLGCVVWSNQL